jgi:hypothetical protein
LGLLTGCSSYERTTDGLKIAGTNTYEYEPRLVNEFDGGKIYKFWSSEDPYDVNWHFFVIKSDNSTQTSSIYKKTSGKVTKHYDDEIDYQ